MKSVTKKNRNGVTVTYSNNGRTVTRKVVRRNGSCFSSSTCTVSNDGCSCSSSSVSICYADGGGGEDEDEGENKQIAKPAKTLKKVRPPKKKNLLEIVEGID